MFRDRTHGRDALVVLDNAADEAQVRDLIPASPSCLVLITSRRSLTGLDGAHLHILDVLGTEESVRLLARIAGAERVGAEPEPEAAERIAALCGGLPLADRLSRGIGQHATRGRDVAAVFELSYRGLPEPAQRVFRLSGIGPGPDATPETAAALAGINLEQTDQIMDLLQDEHLVDQRVPGRFELHDLLRAYAAETCASNDSAAERRTAVDDY